MIRQCYSSTKKNKRKKKKRWKEKKGTPGREVVQNDEKGQRQKKKEEKIKGRKGKMGASGARCRRSGGLEAASRCIASGPIVGPHNTVMIQFWVVRIAVNERMNEWTEGGLTYSVSHSVRWMLAQRGEPKLLVSGYKQGQGPAWTSTRPRIRGPTRSRDL